MSGCSTFHTWFRTPLAAHTWLLTPNTAHTHGPLDMCVPWTCAARATLRAGILKMRGAGMRKLLDDRQRSERQYVSSLADIIENTPVFRSMPASNIRETFGKDTSDFATAHLAALKFSIITKEQIELCQGVFMCMCMCMSICLHVHVCVRV